MYHHHHHHHHHHQSIMVWILFGIIVTGMLHWRTIISITLYILLVLYCLVSAPVRCYFGSGYRYQRDVSCDPKKMKFFIFGFFASVVCSHATAAGTIELDSGEEKVIPCIIYMVVNGVWWGLAEKKFSLSFIRSHPSTVHIFIGRRMATQNNAPSLE